MADKKSKVVVTEKLAKMTVKELRAEVIRLGMPEEDAENFETKKPLIATINTLRAQKVVETPGQLKKEKKAYLSKKERMRAVLMAQPTVRILIPLEGKQKKGVVKWVYNERNKRKEQVYVEGAYTPVQINGFKWFVPHGVYTEVPRQIADMIAESQQVTQEAGKDWLVDRDDPKTGGKVRDKLE